MAMRIETGAKVAYSVQFLRSIGQSHSDMARARGVVTEIGDLGSIQLARISWDANMPERVNVKNLAIVGPNRQFANVD